MSLRLRVRGWQNFVLDCDARVPRPVIQHSRPWPAVRTPPERHCANKRICDRGYLLHAPKVARIARHRPSGESSLLSERQGEGARPVGRPARIPPSRP